MNDLGTLTEAEKREIFPELYHGPERLEWVEGSDRPLVAATRSGDEPMAAETAKRESHAVAPGEAEAVILEGVSALDAAAERLERDGWQMIYQGSRHEGEVFRRRAFGVRMLATALKASLPKPDSEASFSELRGRRKTQKRWQPPTKTSPEAGKLYDI